MQKFLLQVIRPARKPTNHGIPFSDPCSQRLRQWMGISSEQLYNPKMAVILPMGFYYSGTGKQGDFPPRPECEAAWRSSLLSHLQGIEITIVLGRFAQDYHFNHRSSN